MKVTNKGTAPYGIWAKSGLVFIPVNGSRDVDLTPEQVEEVGKISGLEVEATKPKAEAKGKADDKQEK